MGILISSIPRNCPKDFTELDMALPTIEVTCSDKGTTATASVLERSDRRLKVAMGEAAASISLILSKNAPTDKYFIGNKFGMEFTTTGEEV